MRIWGSAVGVGSTTCSGVGILALDRIAAAAAAKEGLGVGGRGCGIRIRIEVSLDHAFDRIVVVDGLGRSSDSVGGVRGRDGDP